MIQNAIVHSVLQHGFERAAFPATDLAVDSADALSGPKNAFSVLS